MNQKQRDNIAKYLYDISKILLAALFIAPIAAPESFKAWIFISGLVGTILWFSLAVYIDGKGGKR